MEHLKPYIRIARPDHWIKQFFIVPGIALAFLLVDCVSLTESLPRLIAAFLSTCLIASANYVINEWLDSEFDKYHPVKKQRPVVSGSVKLKGVIIEYLLLAVPGLAVGLLAGLFPFLMVLWLLVMGILYNVRPFRTKEIPYVDVLSESVNNAIRLLIGWFAVTGAYYPPVSIVLGYWMGGAFLMATKRYAEYRMIGDKTQAALYRRSFKYYSEKTLLISAFFYALLSVFFIGVFMLKYRAEFILDIPVICGMFCLYLNIAYKEDSSAQKPEKLFREKGLMLYLLFFVILTAVLLVVDIPFLHQFAEPEIIAVVH